MKLKKKIVLAYSGGLDTSIILKWLQENYNAEVICYTADIGQEINQKKIISNAKKFGVKNIIIKDLKDIFIKDYVFPMIRGHAVYEGVYLLGTSIARPLIAKDQIRVAEKYKAYAVSHGSTGKGNDQVRFELGYHYFNPKIKVIAPWRIWKLKSRTDLINYAKRNKISIPKDKKVLHLFLLTIIYFILQRKVRFWRTLKILHQNRFFKEQFRQKKRLINQHFYQLILETEIQLELIKKNFLQQSYLKNLIN